MTMNQGETAWEGCGSYSTSATQTGCDGQGVMNRESCGVLPLFQLVVSNCRTQGQGQLLERC